MDLSERVLTMRHLSHNRGQMAPVDRITAVRKGLPVSSLDAMASKLSMERAALLSLLGVSSRTIQRRRQARERLSFVASDRLSRVERIFQLASTVFGDSEKASAWLQRPSRGLQSVKPLELLDTDAGTQQVEQELREIEHGFVY
jgi:putative toxin-antitoxin system antitoxin component (TIGR02293 family)